MSAVFQGSETKPVSQFSDPNLTKLCRMTPRCFPIEVTARFELRGFRSIETAYRLTLSLLNPKDEAVLPI